MIPRGAPVVKRKRSAEGQRDDDWLQAKNKKRRGGRVERPPLQKGKTDCYLYSPLILPQVVADTGVSPLGQMMVCVPPI